nr:unnamed protein product [Spirometra erinaceieuropaei]
MFISNGYPRGFIERSRQPKKAIRPTREQPKVWRALPYIENVSEAVARLLQPLGIGVAHRPEATIRRLVMRPKAPLSRGETANVVYRVQCSSCEANYVGETGKRLQTRMSEHARAVRRMDQLSLVAEHCAASGHTFAFENAEILGRGTDQTARETLEAWHTVPTSINRCTILPAAYQALRVRFNQRNQRQEVRTTSPSEHCSRPNTDDGGQQADKGDAGNGSATTEVHKGRGKRATITRNAGQAQQMRSIYLLLGSVVKMPEGEATPEQRTSRVFELMDKDRDDRISLEEFLEGVQTDPDVLQLLKLDTMAGPPLLDKRCPGSKETHSEKVCRFGVLFFFRSFRRIRS